MSDPDTPPPGPSDASDTGTPSPASQPAPPASTPGGESPPKREFDPASNAWSMACHLSALTTFLLPFGIVNLPGLIAPLVLWQVLENAHPAAVQHAKEAFNFQLHVLAATGICLILASCCIGIPMLLIVNGLNIGLTLYAASQAANGERWRYPGIYRVLR